MITKHKTTHKAVEKILPNSTRYNHRLFDWTYDRHLKLIDRKKRLKLIHNAKLEAQRQLKILEEQYEVAMKDVLDHGGTLR